jgi:hypothetical protein
MLELTLNQIKLVVKAIKKKNLSDYTQIAGIIIDQIFWLSFKLLELFS